jgi:hydrogenase nickel incorporation protein HypA/HybF
MHELSLATEVIELARREAAKNNVSTILEIQIEVGDLSGVEADAFQSALELIVKDTILENAVLHVIRTTGKGRCNSCNMEFEMKNRLDVCPECHRYPSLIVDGEEFSVVSILVEQFNSIDTIQEI